MKSADFYYLFLVQVIAFVVFLIGFLPIPKKSGEYASLQSLPRDLNGFPFNTEELYTPKFEKIVLIIIDALRADYILNDDLGKYMPYLKELHDQKQACTYPAKAHTPTVTLPRIKALVSGSIPGFADVVFNLGSPQMDGDNIIHQLKNSERKIVFYGDETWLRLFPDDFLRSEGTTSFFVNDYTEVDLNVTRHLNGELQKNDWSVMILHYLGLDHIGHISGPRSSLVPSKLSEMDQVIQQIHKQLPDQSAIIICGDHGMSDSGSHGGSSPAETEISLTFVANGCSSHQKVNLQVDLAPTLSVLMGIPPPTNSLGSLIEGILFSETLFTSEQRLYASYVNAKTVARQYGDDELYLKSLKLYGDYLHGVGTVDERRITESFLEATETMNRHLIKNLVTFDLYMMIIAIILSFQVLLITSIECFTDCEKITVSFNRRVLFSGAIFTSVMFHVAICLFIGGQSCACFSDQQLYFVVLINIVTFTLYSVNLWYLIKHNWLKSFNKLNFGTLLERFLLIGTILHAVSLGSSSFVEEEHQTFYFFCSSFVILFAISDHGQSKGNLIGALVLMRISRSWNQTGDKWINESDIEDWLNAPEHKAYLSISSVLGAFGIHHWIKRHYHLNWIQRIASIIALIATLAYRAALGTFNFSYPKSIGTTEATVAYASIALILLFSRHQWNSGLTIFWILLTSLVKRPHNLLLTVLQLWQYSLMQSALNSRRLRPFYRGLAHYWLGMAWYFHQGNGNNLARIDLSAGYVGLSHYNPVIVGFLLSCATYSGPVLSYLFSLQYYSVGMRSAFLWCRSLVISLFFVIVTCLRYHLFVWTVFSPKLLYEGVFTCFLLFAIFCTIPSIKSKD